MQIENLKNLETDGRLKSREITEGINASDFICAVHESRLRTFLAISMRRKSASEHIEAPCRFNTDDHTSLLNQGV
jgi:hypothetical protein